MPGTRVKICGITRPEDAAAAAELGADAIGLNFVGGPRKLTLAIAEEILRARAVPDVNEPMPHLERTAVPVALCHAPSREAYGALWPAEMARLRISRFQVYGIDTMQLLANMGNGIQVWPVVHLAAQDDATSLLRRVEFGGELNAYSAIVVDAAASGQLGGTGTRFDWSWLAPLSDPALDEQYGEAPPIILAGGLTPDNVADAIRIARPYAVDVSSGVEVPGKPGIKDPIRMRDFIQAAQGA